MNNQSDVLGTIALSQKIDELQNRLDEILDTSDPMIDLIPESDFSKQIRVSGSTLRGWRADGTLKECWVKKGKHIWWSPRIFREELLKNA